MDLTARRKWDRDRCLPVPPAVANAVYDAVGVRIDEVPITPEKVLKALRDKGERRRWKIWSRRGAVS